MQIHCPKFSTVLASVALILCVCGLGGWQVLSPPWAGPAAAGARTNGKVTPTSGDGGDSISGRLADNSFAGNLLLLKAVDQLAQHRSIVAKIRHRVDLFGHELIGSGTYRQLDVDQYRLLRLELKIPLDDQITSILQVCDSRFLWLQQTMPDKLRGVRTIISRVDLDEIRRATVDDSNSLVIRPDNLLIGQGGLPQLLIELERHFAFHDVRAGTLHQVPVWITWGEWKPAALQLLFREKNVDQAQGAKQDELLAKLPRHVPHSAMVILGQQDLFPYQFEYRRSKDASRSRKAMSVIETADSRAMVTMELFEVQFGAVIDPIQFVFKLGDRPFDDRTRDYLRRFSRSEIDVQPSAVRESPALR